MHANHLNTICVITIHFHSAKGHFQNILLRCVDVIFDLKA